METITVYTKEELRTWFKKHHTKENKVAIILHKKHTGKSAPSHREQIEEAICFGWIDTTIKRIDEDTFMRRFSKRTQSSKWSDNALSYAKRLVQEGKMAPEGLRFYELGLAKPTHDHGIPKNPPMPLELKEALSKNKKANENFEKFPPSTKKMLYRFILRGKLQATRSKRIAGIVGAAQKGKRDGI